MEIFVARQPIFDDKNDVIAYELLYRNGIKNSFDKSVSGNVATSIVLTNSFLTFGIQNLIEDKMAFVNFDKHLIMSGIVELLDSDKVIIELLETIVPDEKFINRVKALKDKGYKFAIDDYFEGYVHKTITEVCDIVKVDFMNNSREGIAKLTWELKQNGKLLLAEKVESKEEFEWAKSIGYKYFQGYYFAKPVVEKRKTFSESAVQYIRLMDQLSEEEPNFSKISSIIEIDVSLTYKLLKLVNSKLGLTQEIVSVQHAIMLLGLKSFSRWLSLAMVQNIGQGSVNELSKYALIRSYMLDRIAGTTQFSMFRDELVLIGTLSVVDVILEMDMQKILEQLPLSDGVKGTLLGEETMFSDCYNLVLAYEKAMFSEAETYAKAAGYSYDLLSAHYIEAVQYADDMYEALNKDNE